MTVSTTNVTVSYAGNDTATAFPITFQFGTSADLQVFLVLDADDSETLQVLDTHYTVAQSASGTGTLTMLTAPATGYTLRIDRHTTLTQPDSLRNQGAYYPETIEGIADRLTRKMQEVDLRSGGPQGEPGLPDTAMRTDLAATTAGKGGELVGYKSDKANAVATTTTRRLRNLDLDWEDFGIVADGATDDSTALERALNAASGRRLILPHGSASSPKIVKITRQLVLTSAIAPQLLGEGSDKTIIRFDGGATLPNDLIAIVGTPRGIRIQGVGFDANGATSTLAYGVLGIQNGEDIEIAYCSFTGFDKIGLAFNGCRYFNVHHNRFERTTSAGTYNQAFLLSSSARAAKYGEFSHNVCVNSATDFDGSQLDISHNEMSGWAFGAGVTMEQSANTHSNAINFNTLHDSGTGSDVNGFRPAGIENWGKNTTLIGNKCYGNSGSGIEQGGQHCYVAGNLCYDNGNSGVAGVTSGGDGIVSRYGDATYNASYSTYVGNDAYDTRTNKLQGYGYQDQSSSLTGITLRGNRWGAHLTGTENIISANCDYSGPCIEASASIDFGTVAAGATSGSAVNHAAFKMGDFVQVSSGTNLDGVNLWGYVSSNGQVAVRYTNTGASGSTLGSITVRVKATKPMGYVAF